MPVIGARQSPINIVRSKSLQLSDPKDLFTVDYAMGTKVTGTFKAHNFELDPPVYPQITFRHRRFNLRRIHIHHASEHLFDDRGSEFEIHLVHFPDRISTLTPQIALDAPKVVVGILYREGPDGTSNPAMEWMNRVLGPILEGLGGRNLPLRALNAEPAVSEDAVDPTEFFRRDDGAVDLDNWFHYEGSLTTGTFSEDVSWFVMDGERVVNPNATFNLKAFADQDARPIHAVDRRLLVHSFAPQSQAP